MGARFYVPSIGRFASADVIIRNPDNPQSHNRYSYVYNNPLRFRDADGHRPCELVCPGEWIPNGSFTGSAWYGPWDIQKQRENSARAQSLIVNFVSTTVGIIWEPADWAIALSDGVQWYDGLGILPLVPAVFGDNIGRAATRLIPAGIGDEVGGSIRAVGHWAPDNSTGAWKEYEEFVTGVKGMVFNYNGAEFDGIFGTMDASRNIGGRSRLGHFALTHKTWLVTPGQQQPR